MARQVYINGKLVPAAEAKVSVFDHALLYGDGVFEGLRIYGGRVFRLEDHITRLYESARAIWLEIPIDENAMCRAVNDTVKANDLSEGYVRLIVTRGTGTLGLDANVCKDSQIIIIADTIALYPHELYASGLEIVTASTLRNHPAALNPRIKSLNYLNNILAKIEGAKAGCIEVLMLNHKGEVAECSGDNIFIVKNGELVTPPKDAGILAGITRKAVIELASAVGIAVHEVPLTRHDVYVADECFLTGTAAEVIAVVKVDNRTIGIGKPGRMTQDLERRFKEMTRK
jgi:branched-chain amino acid aminotransferase